MAVPVELERIGGRESRPDPRRGGGGGRPPAGRGWGGGGDESPLDDGYRTAERLRLAVWIGIAGIVMFFAAISSALVVRRAGEDWRTLDLPGVLFLSTALLVASSGAFEAARRQLRGGTLERLRGWIAATVALGLGFLVAQWLGWSELAAQGVGMASNPSGSFFFLLTIAHALHVAGGLAALGYVAARVWSDRPWPHRLAVVDAAAVYWHFMDVLWIYLFILLAVWG
jgi:cytochrome c oxidase subunit III